MTKRTAIVFGATGLVGSYLMKLLRENDRYANVSSFSRRHCGYANSKLAEQISDLDLDDTDSLTEKITDDDLFCCPGTTIKKAHSQENFRKLILTFPYNFPPFLPKINYEVLWWSLPSVLMPNHQIFTCVPRDKWKNG